MKLIDVLVMISKGELKEGTKIVWKETEYTYVGNDLMDEEDDYSLFDFVIGKSLNDEVEIIGKYTNVATKIEEIDMEFLRYTFEYGGKFRPVKAITSLGDKLNEVIRELNRRSE